MLNIHIAHVYLRLIDTYDFLKRGFIRPIYCIITNNRLQWFDICLRTNIEPGFNTVTIANQPDAVQGRGSSSPTVLVMQHALQMV